MEQCMEVQVSDLLQSRLEQVYWQENEDAYHKLLAEYYATCGRRGGDTPMREVHHGWQRMPFQTLSAFQTQPQTAAWSQVTLQKRTSESMEDLDVNPRRKIVVRGPGPLRVQ